MSIFSRPYTIGDLMNIDFGRQERASGCSVELVKVYHQIKPEALIDKFKNFFTYNRTHLKAYFLILKLKVISGTGNTHIVFIKINPDFNLNRWESNRVKIYCDCADFKYRSAYILNDRHSLFLTDRIKLSLGSSLTDKPKATAKTSLLCKHAFAAIQWLINNYANLMRTI